MKKLLCTLLATGLVASPSLNHKGVNYEII
jgi:hypothetical protein